MRCIHHLGTALCAVALAGTGIAQDNPPSLPSVKEERSFQNFQKAEYFQNGSISAIRSYKSLEDEPLIKHGPTTTYHPSGSKKSEGTYVENKRQGLWKFWAEDGACKQGIFTSGSKAGIWQTKNAQGSVTLEESYSRGKLHGKRTAYHNDGTVASEDLFHNGVRQGPSTSWHANGQKASESFWTQGRLNGKIQAWNNKGQQLLDGQYLAGSPTGTWSWFDQDGTKLNESDFSQEVAFLYQYEWPHDQAAILTQETPYKAGLVHGTVKQFFRDSGAVARETAFTNGVKEGLTLEYFPNGQVKREMYFSNNLPSDTHKEFYVGEEHQVKSIIAYSEQDSEEAKVQEFYPTGEKKSEYTTYRAVQEGPFTLYHRNGTVAASGSYQAGKKQGLWEEFYPTGSIAKQANYLADQLDGQYQEWFAADSESDEPVKKIEGMFANNLRVDRWTQWYTDGSKHMETFYEAGMHAGPFKKYYSASGIKKLHEAQEQAEEKTSSDFANHLQIEGNFASGLKEGTWVSYHPNGFVESRIHYTSGLKDGAYEEWHAHLVQGSPQPKVAGQYRNDLQVGEWTRYFETGGKQVVQSFENGKLQGEIQEFYANGALKSTTEFQQGLQDGTFTHYHPNQKAMVIAQYKQGLLDGAYQVFYENGHRSVEGSYARGLPVGSWQWFEQKGENLLAEESFQQGSGTMLSFYPTGEQKSATPFVAGLKHGEEVQWYPSGQVRSKESFSYGLVNGVSQVFSEEGALLSQVSSDMGLRHGETKLWYGNEQERLALQYVYDIPQGQSYEWYENGQVKTQGDWSDGSRSGVWQAFSRYGEPLLEEVYNDGVLSAFTTYQEEVDEVAIEHK